jgi:3-dehydroquinate synthase
MDSVRVNLGSRSYEIAFGASAEGFRFFLGRCCPRASKYFFVADENTQILAKPLAESFGHQATLAVIPSGEPSKSLAQVASLYTQLAAILADRQTPVVAVGGGVVGDLAGFVAATYNRGIPLVMVPTTLLAMVDSAVGGKVGINLPEGKNLVGAFHQPAGVWVNTQHLQRLPEREYRSGLAEVVKYGVILDAEFLHWLENHTAAILNQDSKAIETIVARSCQLKASVVERDEREETGLRMILNYGHTFGHAFEVLGGYGNWLHGEAVAAGMACAARLSLKRGLISAEDARRQNQLLERFSLPTQIPSHWDPYALIEIMRRDKKNTSGRLRCILPIQLGEVRAFDDVSDDEIIQVLQPS